MANARLFALKIKPTGSSLTTSTFNSNNQIFVKLNTFFFYKYIPETIRSNYMFSCALNKKAKTKTIILLKNITILIYFLFNLSYINLLRIKHLQRLHEQVKA